MLNRKSMNQKVTYNKAFGIFLIITSSFIIGVSFLIGFSLNTFTGGILMVMGILYLKRPVIEYNENEIMMKNLYGTTMRKYSFSTDKITVKDGSMYTNDKKIRAGSFMLNRLELEQLHQFIAKKNN